VDLHTMNFLEARFREYYLQESLEMPPNFRSREWGFILFDPRRMMHRHKSFLSRNELVDYIRTVTPAHAYHSAAIYQQPGAPTMKEKGWIGTDLIFDLDADHLRNAPSRYGDMLTLVKRETLKLLDFLLSDFGFSDQDIDVVFSGGRGYHIHVRDPMVQDLGSGERREIVDYLTGRGLDIERYFSEKSTLSTLDDDIPSYGHQRSPIPSSCQGLVAKWTARKLAKEYGKDPNEMFDLFEKILPDSYVNFTFPREDATGWGSRIHCSILSFVERLHELDEEEAVEMLSSRAGFAPPQKGLFRMNDLENPGSLVVKLRNAKDPVSRYLRDRLSPEAKQLLLSKHNDTTRKDVADSIDRNKKKILFKKILISELNQILQDPSPFDMAIFMQADLINKNKKEMERVSSEYSNIRFKRLLLEKAYPNEFKKSMVTKFYELLMQEDVFDQIREGNLSCFKGSSQVWRILIENDLKDASVTIGTGPGLRDEVDSQKGETDEPVTTDIKRLIRFPLSLHGGTGLRVTPLSIDALRIFDPLSDAVVFGDDPVEVCLSGPFELEMRGEYYRWEGGSAEVPLCVAVFLMARGAAELGKALEG